MNKILEHSLILTPEKNTGYIFNETNKMRFQTSIISIFELL